MGTEEGEIKGIDNLLNKIIPKSFPNVEKERAIHVQEAYRTTNHQDQKGNTPRHIIIKIFNIQNNNTESRKRKWKSHIKANPLE
jgi:hypothetical protein